MAIVMKKAKEKKILYLSKDSDERSTNKIKLLKYIDIVNELHKDIITTFNVDSPAIVRKKKRGYKLTMR